MNDNFYKAFEDRYRGSREEIAARLRVYQPFLAPLSASTPARALDLGCGRGEFLELLASAGFDASGVDLDDGMLAACRERGLAVQTGDALSALRELPDDSLALVSAFHLVEHLPFELVQDLIGQALRVLRPGGLLIMETPNPENLSVGASSFYLDPSHKQPIPPTLLDFVAGYAGFARHKVVRLQENERARSGARPRLIDVLEGTSADYAVVAQKAAPAPVMALLDAPFEASYGITLGTLAERYDDEAERVRSLDRQADLAYAQQLVAHQNAELRHAVDVAVADMGAQLSAALGQLAQRSAEHENTIARHEQLLAEQSRLNAEYRQRIIDLMSSTSWKVTEPLRWVSGQMIRTRAMVRERRVLSAFKHRAKPLLLTAMRAALRRPKVKNALRAVLRRFPGLQARLYGVLTRDTVQAAAEVAPQQYGALSPRAMRIFEQLKQELDARNKN